jgi:predicted Zn finger-like uncharacterized protein
MSLITRCPSCGTQFKVVPDQLKISHGWVRCGHCAEVFDASQRLEKAPQAAQTAAESTADGDQTATTLVAPREENTLVTGDFDATTAPLPAAAAPAQDATPPQDTAPSPLRPQPRELSATSLPSFADELAALAERSNHPSRWPKGQSNSRFELESVLEWADSAPKPAREEESDDPFADSLPGENSKEQHAALSQLSFVRQAKRKAFWRRPVVRVFSVLICLALAALLAAQVAVHRRDQWAATQPELKPYLVQLCAQVGCQIKPLQQIESIAIDSSSFNKARSDARQETYTLSFVIKNNATMPLAAPALELTLTDTQDSPVLRRTLAPAEYGARSELITANSELNSSVALAVSTSAGGLPPGRVAGYRLLAFYP